MSVLLIDAGNTRIKWQTRLTRTPVTSGVLEYDALNDRTPVEWPVQMVRVVVASVKEHPRLRQLLDEAYGSRVTWLSQPLLEHPSFQHCYVNPERLGVDRWLAMLGAREQASGDILVVDAGTALTIDVLNGANQHLGGYIVPGVSLAQQALFQSTERVMVYQDEHVGQTVQLGQDTRSCVASGALRQQETFVQALLQEHVSCRPFITGGDGQWLAQRLGCDYYPDLIFDGMDALCAGSLLP